MNKNPGVTWWWYAGEDAPHLASTFSTDGSRAVDLRTYFVNGQRLFTAIELIDH
jgi:hypothetical protein